MKYKNRAAAPANLLTKTELKQQRLKPGAHQCAVYYWQGHAYVTRYDPAYAVPMRPRREPMLEQLAALAAGRALVGTSLCSSCEKRTDNFELDRGGRCNGCVLAAEREDGITDQDVEDAPTWAEVGRRVAGILAGRLAISHNADFDSRMLQQTCTRHSVAMPAFNPDCTMELLTEMNGGRWPSLGAAASLGVRKCQTISGTAPGAMASFADRSFWPSQGTHDATNIRK